MANFRWEELKKVQTYSWKVSMNSNRSKEHWFFKKIIIFEIQRKNITLKVREFRKVFMIENFSIKLTQFETTGLIDHFYSTGNSEKKSNLKLDMFVPFSKELEKITRKKINLERECFFFIILLFWLKNQHTLYKFLQHNHWNWLINNFHHSHYRTTTT